MKRLLGTLIIILLGAALVAGESPLLATEMWEVDFSALPVGSFQKDCILIQNTGGKTLMAVAMAYDLSTGEMLDMKEIEAIRPGRGAKVILTDIHRGRRHVTFVKVMVEAINGVSDALGENNTNGAPFKAGRALVTRFGHNGNYILDTI